MYTLVLLQVLLVLLNNTSIIMCNTIRQEISLIPAVITHEDISILPILSDIRFHLPAVNITAGNPSDSYQLILDLTYEHSYIGSTVLPAFTKEIHLANIPKSTTATIADDGIIKGPLVRGQFGFADLLSRIAKPFEYGVMEHYITSDNEYANQRIVLGYDGKLGLSRDYIDTSSPSSYMRLLKQSGIINERIFAIELRNNAMRGIFTIDDPTMNALAYKLDQQRPLPKREIAPYTSYSYLRNDGIALWYCQANYVHITNSKNNIKVFNKNIYGQDVSLMTTLPFIVSPQIDILTALYNHLTAYDNVCTIFQKKQNSYYFLKCSYNRGFDDLDVVFELTTFGTLKLSKENLFYRSVDKQDGNEFYICTIAAAGQNLGIWRMGLPMFMDKRVVFDMEHKLVYFQELMGDDDDDEEEERMCMKVLMIVMAVVMSAWSAVLVSGNKIYYKLFTV